jgi:hypothetical protein
VPVAVCKRTCALLLAVVMPVWGRDYWVAVGREVMSVVKKLLLCLIKGAACVYAPLAFNALSSMDSLLIC